MIVQIDGQNVMVKEKTFSTGSKGFNATGKIIASNGKRYQVSANVIEIGSKPGSKVKQPKQPDKVNNNVKSAVNQLSLP